MPSRPPVSLRLLRALLPLLAVAAACVALPRGAAANAGTAICVLPAGARVPLGIVAESDSGAIVLYYDSRNNEDDIYAQRVDRHGNPEWASGGVLVRNAANLGFFSNVIPDGAGGALIAWDELEATTGHDVVVQRVLSNGTLGYGASGLDICNAANDQGEPQLVPGPTGSYFVIWKDDRTASGGESDLYVQRVTTAGTVVFTANGLKINSATYVNEGGYGNGGDPYVAADLLGGFLVTWIPDGTRTPRVQRMSSAGVLQWTSDGVAYGASGDETEAIAADSSGGALLAFQHYSPFPSSYPYFEHVTSTGTVQYASPGLALSIAGVSASTNFPMWVHRDGSGGAWVYVPGYQSAWSNLYRQHVNSSGTLLISGGQDVADYLSNVGFFDLGDGIAFVEAPFIEIGGRALFQLQRYAYNGAQVYSGNGVILGRSDGGFGYYPGPCADLPGGTTMTAWSDPRYSSPTFPQRLQVFGQALDSSGQPLWNDSELPTLVSVKDAPNDQGGSVRVDWTAGAADLPGAAVVSDQRVWRSVPGTMASSLAKAHPVTHAGTFTANGHTLLAQGGNYWELVGEEPGAQLGSYALTVPTGQDSIAGSSADETFMVEDLDDSTHTWYSGTATGHSVDNLAPPAPAPAAGYYAGGQTTLYWGGVSVPDLCCYLVYRGSSPSFTASPANQVGSTTNVTFTDVSGPSYYQIAAQDIHGNIGPTALVVPTGLAGVDSDAPRVWALRSHWSNTRRAIELALDVPQADAGRIDVFDVSGRRLWSSAFQTDGAKSLAFEMSGGPALSAGLFFARATSASGTRLSSHVLVLR